MTFEQGKRHLPSSENSLRELIASGIHAYLSGRETSKVDRAYDAWEIVRRGRAAEVVGKVVTADGKQLPYTGFEPYYLGEEPKEIVKREVELGKKILWSIHHHTEHLRDPKTGIAYDIPYTELMSALYGGRIPRLEHVDMILGFFDTLLRATLARAKAETSPEKEEFRRKTYEKVENGQTTDLIRQINPAIVVLEDLREIEAYNVIAQIGVFGNPDIKKAIRKLSINPNLPAN